MKKLYFIIALFAVGLMLFTITAQKTIQTPASKFKPGWFAGANGGINWYLAEGNDFLFETLPYESFYERLFRKHNCLHFNELRK